MTSSIDSLTFTVPLTASDRARAQQFAIKMPQPDKAEQVERNTLAVLATHHYLKLLGFNSDLTKSNSWDFLHQVTGNMADLAVPNGRLICCAIGSETAVISLPNVQDGLGYVVVQLDEDYHDAKLLGFAPATASQLHREQLEPLDALVDRLTETPLVRLGDWLANQASNTWETLDALMSPERGSHLVFASLDRTQDRGTDSITIDGSDRLGDGPVSQHVQQRVQELQAQTGMTIASNDPVTILSQLIQQLQDEELRWQAAELLWEINPHHPASPIVRAKDLGLHLAGHEIALLVGLLPKADEAVLVLVRVCSIGTSPVLPSGVQFTGQDVDETQIFDVSSRQQDDYIQFKFMADAGDRFSLTVRLDAAQVTEYFIV